MIFPDWGTAPKTEQTELPLFQEWAVDWENQTFAQRNGQPYLVSGDEALKIWVTKALRRESEPALRLLGPHPPIRQRTGNHAGPLRRQRYPGEPAAPHGAGRAAGKPLHHGGGRLFRVSERQHRHGGMRRSHDLQFL